MAKKVALDLGTLTALGADKLARLVLDEAERDAGFRRIVKAALAATDGPEAVARLVDRRLAALEKARGFIDWQKARAFRDDLASALTTMAGELGEASPALAVDRLLRFLATQDQVYERVDDSSGRIAGVYEDAVEAVGRLAGKLPPDEAERLPETIMTRLGTSPYYSLVLVAHEVVPHLAPSTLVRWDAALEAAIRDDAAKPDKKTSRSGAELPRQWSAVRQAIAEAQGDLDAFVALEAKKHPRLQNRTEIAGRLLAAGRAAEALDWVRREAPTGGLRVMTMDDLADGSEPRDPFRVRRVLLEGRILDALGRRPEAQALRWTAFEETLDAELLKAHVAALPDFEDFAVLDRAFAHVLRSSLRYRALVFFLEWPKHDQAASLVLAHAFEWDGRQYEFLGPAAEALEEDHPLAAAILLRALTEGILDRAYSKAYPHAARYVGRLDGLAERLGETAWPAGINAHAAWRADLGRKHARKSGFMARLA